MEICCYTLGATHTFRRPFIILMLGSAVWVSNQMPTVIQIHTKGPLLLTWIDFNPSMDKSSHTH